LNHDIGPSEDDLRRITVIASSPHGYGGVHRRHPGEDEPPAPGAEALPPPTLLGSAYVFWDGQFSASFPQKSWVGILPYGTAWGTVTGDTVSFHDLSSMTIGPREEWTSISCDCFVVDSLFIAGGPPGILITAGPLSTNDDDDPDNGITWLLESLTGPNGPVLGATVNPTTGVFTWQSQPTSARGVYTAVIRGTNDDTPFGSDTGVLQFEIIVPEPATASLLGAAVLGILAFARRRPVVVNA
jgi:hypothetical protein